MFIIALLCLDTAYLSANRREQAHTASFRQLSVLLLKCDIQLYIHFFLGVRFMDELLCTGHMNEAWVSRWAFCIMLFKCLHSHPYPTFPTSGAFSLVTKLFTKWIIDYQLYSHSHCCKYWVLMENFAFCQNTCVQ